MTHLAAVSDNLPHVPLRGRFQIPSFPASFVRWLMLGLVLPALFVGGGGRALAAAAAPAAAAVKTTPEALTLEMATDRKYYPEGATSDVFLEARINAALPAGDPAKSTRNIAFVLDRSGSMEGESLTQLRRAVQEAVAALDPQDTVSVVTFGSEVETLVEAQKCELLTGLDATLTRIEPVGGSALYDALNQGAAQLRRVAAPTAASHLILVTDGPATKGPRERQDFAKLVELFVGEGITVSTIGLGDEFDEDLLASIARLGHGRFQFLPTPARLGPTLLAEVTARRGLVARDVVLTLEFSWNCEGVESHGWWQGMCESTKAEFRAPYVTAGQGATAFTTARIYSNGWVRPLAYAKLQWTDPADGSRHEMKREQTIRFDPDLRSARESRSAPVMLEIVDLTISDGLQGAIEQIDKNDPRRALRSLRRARDSARDLNYDLSNAAISERIRILETFLDGVQSRALGPQDRKTLRSGLGHEFPIAVAKPEESR